jgi:hypothetical protein
MSKQVSMVEINGKASYKVWDENGVRSRDTWHMPSMERVVRKALSKGIKIEASTKEAKTLLDELLGTIPEEEEPKTVIRYGLKITGGRKSFETNDDAIRWHKRYYAWRGVPLDIKEVKVKA